MLAWILGIDPVWLLVTVPGVLLLGLGSWVVVGLRNRTRESRKDQQLVYRDPALWVRSLPVAPFPLKNPTGSDPSPPPGPVVKSGRSPWASANLAGSVSPIRYGRETRDLREKRCALRRQGNPTTVQIADGSVKELSGWVVDRSTTGLCVACPEDLEVGSTISIRSTHYGDSGPWVLAQVRRCDQFDKGWVIGFSFTDALPWNVLLRFG